MTTKIAIIPARGGSTRLKDKNVYPLAGKPLIGYTIEAVLDSGSFDSVYVSTDSDKIREVALSYDGVQLHERPEEFAGERVTVLEALVQSTEVLPKHDIFAYFLPTCPFRNGDDIRAGVELLDKDTDSVISISQYSEPPQLALLKKDDHVVPVFDNLIIGATNSKYITPYYKPNGGYYMTWWDKLLENKNFFIGNVKGHLLPKERSVDIDDLTDMQIAEIVLQST